LTTRQNPCFGRGRIFQSMRVKLSKYKRRPLSEIVSSACATMFKQTHRARTSSIPLLRGSIFAAAVSGFFTGGRGAAPWLCWPQREVPFGPWGWFRGFCGGGLGGLRRAHRECLPLRWFRRGNDCWFCKNGRSRRSVGDLKNQRSWASFKGAEKSNGDLVARANLGEGKFAAHYFDFRSGEAVSWKLVSVGVGWSGDDTCVFEDVHYCGGFSRGRGAGKWRAAHATFGSLDMRW